MCVHARAYGCICVQAIVSERVNVHEFVKVRRNA